MYGYTATEEEVAAGIFNLKTDPNQCCFWSKRTFGDLMDQKTNDPSLATYTDMTLGKRGVDFDIGLVLYNSSNNTRFTICANYAWRLQNNLCMRRDTGEDSIYY